MPKDRARPDKEKKTADHQARKRGSRAPSSGARENELRDSPMMAHLLDALERGTDIGHFGRLTFAVIARHFLPEEKLVRLLAGQPGQTEPRVRALLLQLNEKDYSPPQRERILEWQARQDFPICPTPDDPDSCNVYRELRFPPGIYDHIQEYWEEQLEPEDRD
jgi:hypothetical protein